MVNDQVAMLVRQDSERIVALRRHFHTFPELGGQEHKTQEKIIAELRALGLKPRKIAGTGIVADIEGRLPGKKIALRADMDALPMDDECGQTYQSQHPGACHSCGHDGHMAMLLGAAKVLTYLQDELNGSIRLMFQPNEEHFPGGARIMIGEGALEGVDAIIASHLWQPLNAGTAGISYGPIMAGAGSFAVTVKGKGGHGSMPHQTVDTILTGTQIVQALHTIVSRNVDPRDTAVISVGIFKAGTQRNIIPATAYLEGTVRALDQNLFQGMFERIRQIAGGICAAAGAECDIRTTLHIPAVVNHPEVACAVRPAVEQVLGENQIIEIKPFMTSEDFGVYLEKIPGMLLLLGSGNADKGIVYPHHHPQFDIDETVLRSGTEIMARSALRLLQS